MESFQKYVTCEKGEWVDRKSDKVTLGGRLSQKFDITHSKFCVPFCCYWIFFFRFSRNSDDITVINNKNVLEAIENCNSTILPPRLVNSCVYTVCTKFSVHSVHMS